MKKRNLIALCSAFMLTMAPFLALAMGGKVPGPNRRPIANAGMDQVVGPHETVVLDGRKSFDPDGDKITYRWQLIYRPTGGHAELFDEVNRMMCCLSPDAAGVWLIRLTVSDGKLTSEPDAVQIQVRATALNPDIDKTRSESR